MSVRVGATQFRGNLRAIDVAFDLRDVVAQNSDVKSGEMEYLGNLRVGQQAHQIGTWLYRLAEFDEMGVAIT